MQLRNLTGKVYLYLGVVALVAVTFIALNLFFINKWKDKDSDTRNRVISAVEVKEGKTFNHILETDIGNFIAEGEVTTDECVSFEEMNPDSCFAKVVRKKEVEVLVQESYPCGENNEDTCWRWVKEWQSRGEDRIEVEEVHFLDKTWPYHKFDISEKRINPKEYIDKGEFFERVTRDYYYPRSDIRYSYAVVPTQYDVVFHGRTQDKDINRERVTPHSTIEKVKEGAKKSPVAPTVVFWIFTVIILAGAGGVGYYIVSRDSTY